MTALTLHPLRNTLNDEVHARPSLPVNTPARITSLAFVFDLDAADSQRAALERLATRLGMAPPPAGAV